VFGFDLDAGDLSLLRGRNLKEQQTKAVESPIKHDGSTNTFPASFREACHAPISTAEAGRAFCFMTTNEDTKEIICETKMQVSAYIIGGGIAIEQLDPMMNESGMIIIHKSDVAALIRALSKLKKSL
jgi:hypothetical protein